MLHLLSLLITPIAASFNSSLLSDDPDAQKLHCPSADDAVASCDPETLIFKYECCGDGLIFCCMRVKQWAWLVGLGAAALLLILLICFCVRCFFGKKTRQSYDFS